MHLGNIFTLLCLGTGALSFKIRAFTGPDCSGSEKDINIWDNTCRGSGLLGRRFPSEFLNMELIASVQASIQMAPATAQDANGLTGGLMVEVIPSSKVIVSPLALERGRWDLVRLDS